MDYTLNNDEKIEACEVALLALEEDVLIECLGLGIEASDVAEDFTSDDPSYQRLVDALARLKAGKEYLAGLSA